MTIDEAIEKYKEITNPDTICLAHCDMFCDKCVQESEQLVEWLEELKALRDNNYKDFYYDKGYSKAENDYHKQSENDRQSAYELGYINAIDDFVISIKGELNRFEVKNLDTCVLFDLMNRKAEQLKGSISSENTNK